ncbi:unnamed protein product, partial [Mesorhabditis belari]|uniref:Uncharacterized protein n=1 Tax=Mesorhabditis belari TaxID=2138241 RepID=A0AAF3EI09_9BILA
MRDAPIKHLDVLSEASVISLSLRLNNEHQNAQPSPDVMSSLLGMNQRIISESDEINLLSQLCRSGIWEQMLLQR